MTVLAHIALSVVFLALASYPFVCEPVRNYGNSPESKEPDSARVYEAV